MELVFVFWMVLFYQRAKAFSVTFSQNPIDTGGDGRGQNLFALLGGGFSHQIDRFADFAVKGKGYRFLIRIDHHQQLPGRKTAGGDQSL